MVPAIKRDFSILPFLPDIIRMRFHTCVNTWRALGRETGRSRDTSTGRNTLGLVGMHPHARQSLEKHHYVQHPRGQTPSQPHVVGATLLRREPVSLNSGVNAFCTQAQPLNPKFQVRLQIARGEKTFMHFANVLVQVCSAHAKEQNSKQPCLLQTEAPQGSRCREPSFSSLLSPRLKAGNIFFPKY